MSDVDIPAPRYMPGWVALVLVNLASLSTAAALLLACAGVDQMVFIG